jgi:hypothetical protein
MTAYRGETTPERKLRGEAYGKRQLQRRPAPLAAGGGDTIPYGRLQETAGGFVTCTNNTVTTVSFPSAIISDAAFFNTIPGTAPFTAIGCIQAGYYGIRVALQWSSIPAAGWVGASLAFSGVGTVMYHPFLWQKAPSIGPLTWEDQQLFEWEVRLPAGSSVTLTVQQKVGTASGGTAAFVILRMMEVFRLGAFTGTHSGSTTTWL